MTATPLGPRPALVKDDDGTSSERPKLAAMQDGPKRGRAHEADPQTRQKRIATSCARSAVSFAVGVLPTPITSGLGSRAPWGATSARGLLAWSQSELADRAGLSLPTVKRAETDGASRVSDEARSKLRRALEQVGVVFIEENGGGPGVRLKRKLKRTPATAQNK
jgi:hypothetical protein